MKERLISRTIKDEESGCWVWQGAKKGMGYGYLTVGSRKDGSRRTAMAHRESYRIFIGPIPDGMMVCHRCDNPSCINPEHLFIGTHQDNIDDRESKGRNNLSGIGLSGECHPKSKLTWSDVRHIRSNIKKRGDISAMARKFNVNHKTISDIYLMKTWLPAPPEE